MKYLLLQHWCGPKNELVERSFANMKVYAKKIGVDYHLIEGKPFDPNMTPPCQKIHMLHKEFDGYDKVVMVDADMFTRKGMIDNVFTDTNGIGRHTAIQTQLRDNLIQRGMGGSRTNPYWGGSIYCLTKKQRVLLRDRLPSSNYKIFNGNYEDEGIMHRLATLIGMSEKGAYLNGNYWNCGSFEPERNKSAFIHIRTKRVQGGPKYPKIDNLNLLVKEGLIDG
jgi:hypothetical protein